MIQQVLHFLLRWHQSEEPEASSTYVSRQCVKLFCDFWTVI